MKNWTRPRRRKHSKHRLAAKAQTTFNFFCRERNVTVAASLFLVFFLSTVHTKTHNTHKCVSNAAALLPSPNRPPFFVCVGKFIAAAVVNLARSKFTKHRSCAAAKPHIQTHSAASERVYDDDKSNQTSLSSRVPKFSPLCAHFSRFRALIAGGISIKLSMNRIRKVTHWCVYIDHNRLAST